MSRTDGKLICDWCLRTVRPEEIAGKVENPIHMCVECWEQANRRGRPRDQWRANHETKIPEARPIPPGFRFEDTPLLRALRDLESMPTWTEDEIGDNVIRPDRRPESDTRNDVDTPE